MSSAEKIEHEAALWTVRLERGLTAAEQDDFLAWLTADPRHGDELGRQKTGWKRLDLLADWRPEHGRQPNRDLLAPPPAKVISHFKRRVRHVLLPALAVAAAVALVLRFYPAQSIPAAIPAAPAKIALIEERRLEDGSTIELNRGAQISVRYTPVERRVLLTQGEAHFTVAKNKDRPFIVSVRGVDFRAVGTAFNVNLSEQTVELLVTEGTVRVQPPVTAATSGAPASSGLVAAGERTVISLAAPAPAAVTAVTSQEMDTILSWQPKLLDFTDAPLAEIVAEFNRRNAPVQLVIADPALAGKVLNASLRSDNIEGFLRLLDGGFGVTVERSGNVVLLRQGRP